MKQYFFDDFRLGVVEVKNAFDWSVVMPGMQVPSQQLTGKYANPSVT